MSDSSTTGDDPFADSVVRVGAPVRKGDVLDRRYQVEEVLGIGGMGVVVAARNINLGSRVALKFLLPGPARDPAFCKRFLREAQATTAVRSEHVARVLDVGRLESGAPYMVMEYLEGSDLALRVREQGALPIKEAIDYVLQAAEALAEAHLAGIIHRDLKPANLFVTERADGSPLVKLLDFGISKTPTIDPNESDLTKVSSMLGSPHYMSPEQIRSTKSVDARSDIWSLGVILFELVTGKMPFAGGGSHAILSRILGDEVAPRATGVDPMIPPAIDAAIAKCMSKDRLRRYQSLAELASDLAPFGSVSARFSSDRITKILGRDPPLVDDEGPTAVVQPRRESKPEMTRTVPDVIAAPTPGATFAGASMQSKPGASGRRALFALVALLGVAFVGFMVLFVAISRKKHAVDPGSEVVRVATPVESSVVIAPLPTVTEPAPVVEPPPPTPAPNASVAADPVRHQRTKSSTTKPVPKKPGATIDDLINERK